MFQNKGLKESFEEIASKSSVLDKIISFNSNSSRFRDPIHYKKYTDTTPGPGEYDKGRLRSHDDIQLAISQLSGINIAKIDSNSVFKNEPRLKHAAIDSYVKEKSQIVGPGAYNINKSSVKKKTYNYELAQNIG